MKSKSFAILSMAWKEFTVDNCMDTSGQSRRKDKALIMIFETKNVLLRITARYHDGHFKWYLDCAQADVYESWLAVTTVESRRSIKIVAIDFLKRRLSNDIRVVIDLNTAEKLLTKAA